MNLLTMDMLILIILAIVMSQTAVFVYIALVMKNDEFYKAQMTYFRAYFLFVIFSILFTSYLITHHILIIYNISDIGYLIAGSLLVMAIYQHARTWKTGLSLIAVIMLLGGINVYYALHTVFIGIHAFFALVVYTFLSYQVVLLGKSQRNDGYFILAGAFGIQVLSSLILIYELFHHSYELAQTTIFVSNVIGYLLVGIGFMSMILIFKHNLMLEASLCDPLTTLHNRRGLEHMLQGLIPVIEREQKEMSVAVIDIDFFKNINDTYGHHGGDTVLSQLGKYLESVKRQSDICCRFGGEEFVLILPNTDKDNAKVIVEKIRTGIEELTILFEENKIKLTASFGIATGRRKIKFDEMLKEADKALYRAKNMGRNCLCHSEDIS